MVDQILSQDEIDALISAMDKGEVDVETDTGGQPGVAAYDLTAQQAKVLSGEFEALELIYDELVKLLRSSLSSSLGRVVEVKFVSSEMVKFGVFLESFGNPTGFAIFGMDPLVGSGLLAIETGLMFSIIDCMFGGVGKSVAKIREFTVIEQGVLKKVSTEVMRVLEKTWGLLLPVEITVKKIETKPQFVHIASPDDTAVTMVVAVSNEEFSGNLYICLPYLMLEPVKDKLSFKNLKQVAQNSKWNENLLRLLDETRLGISVQLGTTVQTIGDVLNLQKGDVIKLDTGPQDPVLIKVEQVPKYHGFPGIVKGNRAVEITSILRETGGN